MTATTRVSNLPVEDGIFVQLDAGFASDPLASFEGSAGAPTPGLFGATLTQVMYLKETGDSASISVNDVHQGQLGDCFLLSSIGEIALFHSANISNMIKVNANGTETITLYKSASGAMPGMGTTSYKPVTVTIDNVFPTYAANNAAGQDQVGTQKEIWLQVLEKAFATLGGGYGSIAYGGNPALAMEVLTGKAASYYSPGQVTTSFLTTNSAAGNLMVFDTANSSALPYNLVGNHAYMFEKLTTVNGVAMVQLGNPWGFDQPASIPVSQLSKAFVEIDVGKV